MSGQVLLLLLAVTSATAIFRRPVRVAVLRGPPHHVHRGYPVLHHHPVRRPHFAVRPKAPPPLPPLPPRAPALLWDEGSFRAPAHKEAFNPQPAGAGPGSDDDKGPIHTIPAPNLSLAKPYETSEPLPNLSLAKPYEVSEPLEPTNDQAGFNVQGVPTYYAPDPDPSLPQPKVPAALDPHNVPSDTKQLNALTSQDLLQLLNGVPAGDFQPQFQTFNYEEQYQPDVAQALQRASAEDPATASFYSKIGSGGSGVVSTSFYTTLPSREVAERLAGLQASGQASSQARDSEEDVVLGDKVPDYDDDEDLDAQFGAKIRPKRLAL